MEQWRPIPQWPGYEASTLGQVRSVDRIITRCDGQVRQLRGRSLVQASRPVSGRRTVTLSYQNEQSTEYVAHLVLSAFVGLCSPGQWGLHKDDDPTNDHLNNLRWDTPRENVLDTLRNGHNQARNRTHCPADPPHVLVVPNLVASKFLAGHRKCLTCDRAHAAAQRAKRAGLPYDLAILRAKYYAQIMAVA